jgi:uncharacterized membrane protein
MVISMSRLQRILKHRWLDESDARKCLGAAGIERLEARINESERQHTGEIRICVEASLPLSYLWRDAPARERALMMFSKLGVWDTEANNGVLIYLLLADRAIEIVADRGVTRVVPQAHWDAVVVDLAAALRRGEFEPGLNAALDAVCAQLSAHCPAAEGQANPNELSNRLDLR